MGGNSSTLREIKPQISWEQTASLSTQPNSHGNLASFLFEWPGRLNRILRSKSRTIHNYATTMKFLDYIMNVIVILD